LTCTWVVPDGSWQTEHLGTQDALRGENLLAYASWRSWLQPGEAKAWSAFVSGLSPDEAGVDSLRAFSFSGWEDNNRGEQITGVDLLLKAITGEMDDKEEVKWFRRDADQGDAEAQFNLGVMYHRGRGVLKDYVAAYAWFCISAFNGHEEGKEGRDKLAKKMTPEQIAEAQELSKELLKQIEENKKKNK
jgi:TPR repeat protein